MGNLKEGLIMLLMGIVFCIYGASGDNGGAIMFGLIMVLGGAYQLKKVVKSDIDELTGEVKEGIDKEVKDVKNILKD